MKKVDTSLYDILIGLFENIWVPMNTIYYLIMILPRFLWSALWSYSLFEMIISSLMSRKVSIKNIMKVRDGLLEYLLL